MQARKLAKDKLEVHDSCWPACWLFTSSICVRVHVALEGGHILRTLTGRLGKVKLDRARCT